MAESQSVQIFEHVFTAFGLLLLLPYAIRIVYFVHLYFVRRSSLPRYLLPNAYALVTGASDGIGRGFAHELASRGFNVVLHGRNASKLDKVRAELAAAHPARRFLTTIANASEGGPAMHAAVDAVVAQLQRDLDGPLTVLVNNCGGTSPQRREFLALQEMTAVEVDGIIDLNARFHVHITRALLPLLQKSEEGAKGRRRALVMYTGSLAGSIPGPWLTTYSPAKMFGNAWITALGREMKELNPDVEALGILVGKVTDTSFYHSEPKLFEPASRTMAKSALDRVGCGKLNVTGYWGHAIQGFMIRSMPEFVQTGIMNDAIKGELKLAGISYEKAGKAI